MELVNEFNDLANQDQKSKKIVRLQPSKMLHLAPKIGHIQDAVLN